MSKVHSQHIERKFGFCKISWRIQNFWLQTCKKDWEIHSPDFSVRAVQSTTWKMVLKPLLRKDVNDGCLSVYLERLKSDSGPDVVRANWKLTVLNCKRKDNFFTEIEYLFKKNQCYGENIESMNCLSRDFEPFELDDLYIQCQLIVTCDANSTVFFQCSDTGIKSLSDDLHILYKTVSNPDIVIKIEHLHIPANKAILLSRNSTLASIINRNPDIQVIDLLPSNVLEPSPSDSDDTNLFTSSFINTNAVERIVDYLYCGKLQKVISKPSVCLSQCAVLFDISEVISYYIPDEINLNSAVDVKENVFFWHITDFKSRNDDYILSSAFTDGLMKSIWRLKVFPKGNDNNQEYVSLYAEIYGGNLSLAENACLEFGLIDIHQQFYCFRRMQKSVGIGEIFGFNDFIKRDCLNNAPFLSDGTLRIIFKLRTSTGVPCLSNGLTAITSVTASTNENNFILLSENLRDLFNKSEFSDLTIHCDDETFNVHSFIMVTRSSTFQEIFEKHGVSRNEIIIAHIKSNILRILLSYMYSGVTEDWDPIVTHDLYLAATYFGVNSLISSCSRLIAESYFKSTV